MTFPVVYDPAVRPTRGPTPGARALMAWCLDLHNGVAKNLGIYNPRDVRGGTALSLHAEGRAIDVGYPVQRPDGHPLGQLLASALVAEHEALGVQCVIFARKIWSVTHPTWRTYGGTADHFDHVHVELNRAAAAGLTPDMIRRAFTHPPTQETPMATVDVEAAQRMLNAWTPPDLHIATDGDWGPASTAALKRVLDAVERRINDLEAAARNVSPPVSDADRKLEALRTAIRDVIA